jgi:hypothetical protein
MWPILPGEQRIAVAASLALLPARLRKFASSTPISHRNAEGSSRPAPASPPLVREKRSTMADGATAGASRDNRKAIPVSCALHRGPRGFANLVVEKQGDEIVLDVHVTGACVIIFDEDAATALFEVLRRWLRR